MTSGVKVNDNKNNKKNDAILVCGNKLYLNLTI